MERRLSAILVADVAGYTALMGADEAGTLRRLTDLRREFLEPLITDHHGRIVKLMGDGLLVEFTSVVDAILCALAWQKGVIDRDKGLQFRIGINLGDVIVEGDDIHGDGVNIAARLGALADPGEICLSGDAYRQAKGKVAADFEAAGEQKLKNVAEPVSVYRFAGDSAVAAAPAPAEEPLPPPDKPSIAVLPFVNMSGNPEQEYFSDGMTEDIITELSRFRSLLVIARNSTFEYKGRPVNVGPVGRELGVQYVVEGSVRRSGDRVRITAQLVEAATGNHIWADRYDRDVTDIFAVQDEVTRAIVAAVEPELGVVERERSLRKQAGNLGAWETLQRALWHMYTYVEEDIAEALRLFQLAHELDPGFATAYAYEAYAHYHTVIMGWSDDTEDSLARGIAAAERALALDDRDAVGYFALGRVLTMQGKHDAAIAAVETALELNPNFALAYHGIGFALMLAGRFDEARGMQENARRLSPRDPDLWAFHAAHGLNCILSEDYEAGVAWATKARQVPRPTGFWPPTLLASALASLGRTEDARAALADALKEKPDLSLSYLEDTLPTKRPGILSPLIDGLRMVGLPE